MNVKVNKVQLLYPSVFEPAVFNGQPTKYSASFLLNKEEHADSINQINTMIQKMIDENKVKIPSDKRCLRDADDLSSDAEYLNNCWVLKASNNARPTVIDRNKSPLTKEDGKIYGGCYVNAIVSFWFQSNQFGKRINANLMGIQFVADGDQIGGGPKVASVDNFDAIEAAVEEEVAL